MVDIDWSGFNWPEDECECCCGALFRSHTKWVTNRGVVSRKPCPACGRDDNYRRVTSEPELVTLAVEGPLPEPGD